MATMKLILCISLAIVAVNSAPITKERLRFKVSAKNLPDKDDGFGTIDPYVIITYTEGGSNREVQLGRSDTISDNENPDWGTVFEFDFDRNKNQRWHFKIYDHDNLREDDKGGQAWIDVTDYVDKGQLAHVILDKQGYLTVKSADTQIQQRTTNTPGSLPLAPGSPESAVLTFKVSANGLKDKDNFGKTDPYVIIMSTEGLTGKRTQIGRSTTLSNTKNPQWGESFTFNWNRNKDQYLYFKIYDNDNFREDDTVGKVWVSANDYVAKGQVMTVNLNKGGLLTISRADGLPPNPYNANAAPIQQFPASPVAPVSPNGQTQKFQQPIPNSPQQISNAPQQPQVQQPTKLRFKLSASGLEDRDLIGTSDPYAKVYITQDGLTETLLKKGTKLSDNENPQWPDIYEFNYDPAKHPKLRFLILDEDDNRRDDELGNVSMDAIELVNRNVVILSLSKGSLTVTRI